ncbi:hypothetical protein HK105_202257 [Polyrhizophydium stewartii]|uniref:Uncharacterized protein n=1 Tax=Polyrhizophydium stewartii TaxID=2732419 RepID=A0ABR4NFS4_9FUNG
MQVFKPAEDARVERLAKRLVEGSGEMAIVDGAAAAAATGAGAAAETVERNRGRSRSRAPAAAEAAAVADEDAQMAEDDAAAGAKDSTATMSKVQKMRLFMSNNQFKKKIRAKSKARRGVGKK